MSVFPALVTLVLVMMLVMSSLRVTQDTGLATAQLNDAQLARQRAEGALLRAASLLASGESVIAAVSIEQLEISGQAELGDLPLQLHRVTAVGQGHQARIRLQADYVIDGCESEHDDPCAPRVRRIAWRELPF